MRTPITLDEFLFTLNQDEDCRITLTDFNTPIGEILWTGWKSCIKNYFEQYKKYSEYYVQDFISLTNGIEICISENPED